MELPFIRLVEEIRRSPVEVGSLSHDLQGFSTIPGGDRRISEPSTVVLPESYQDCYFHEICLQYSEGLKLDFERKVLESREALEIFTLQGSSANL